MRPQAELGREWNAERGGGGLLRKALGAATVVLVAVGEGKRTRPSCGGVGSRSVQGVTHWMFVLNLKNYIPLYHKITLLL